MALVNCRECGAKVSDRAPTCPMCGYPINLPRPERRDRPTRVQVTEVQFTRKWIKVFSVLSLAAFFGGLYLANGKDIVLVRRRDPTDDWWLALP